MSRIFTVSKCIFSLIEIPKFDILTHNKREMKQHILFFTIATLCVPMFAYGACSTANLTRCLDSSCAINIGANPAARCQYCGSATAGTPSKSSAMKSISAGSATKYIISDKELKNAPSDPGERYVWTTQKCLEKVSGCTAEDVSDIYDELISQSCKAAGISAEFVNLAKNAAKEKTENTCSTEMTSCITNDKHCGAGYTKCESDSDFTKHFSNCGVESNGCEKFLSSIKTNLIAARDSAFKNANAILQSVVTAYQNARKQKLNSTNNGCKNGSAKKTCIANVCNNNMRHKCDTGYEYEETLANELCKFYDTACARLK